MPLKMGRAYRVSLLLSVSVPLLISCAGEREAKLFRAERDLWKARRLEQGLQVGPDSPPTVEEIERVLDAYRTLLDHSPMPVEDARGESTGRSEIARIRATAYLGVVRMHQLQDDRDAVREILELGQRQFAKIPDLALRFHAERISFLLSEGDYETAIDAYRDLSADLPARNQDGGANVPVQDAPIRAADLLRQLGRVEEANAELDRAETYYRAILDEDDTDQAAALAWIELATVSARRGEYDSAALALERAREAPGAGLLEPRILFILGVTHQRGRGDLEAAAHTFEQLLASFPEDPIVAEALIHYGACLADLGRSDEAVAALDRVAGEFPRDVAHVASAEILAARVLTQAGRWPDALTRYRKLQASHPTTPQAIGVPFEVADHYRTIGETAAAERVLERALGRFGEISEENRNSPSARMADEGKVRALKGLGRWDDAAELLLRLPEVYPNDRRNAMAMLEAARIFGERLNNPQRAASILEELAATSSDSTLSVRISEEAARLRGR